MTFNHVFIAIHCIFKVIIRLLWISWLLKLGYYNLIFFENTTNCSKHMLIGHMAIKFSTQNCFNRNPLCYSSEEMVYSTFLSRWLGSPLKGKQEEGLPPIIMPHDIRQLTWRQSNMTDNSTKKGFLMVCCHSFLKVCCHIRSDNACTEIYEH